MLGRVISILLWFGVLAAATLSAFEFVLNQTRAESAPQQAAAAAMAAAQVVIPYVFARSVDQIIAAGKAQNVVIAERTAQLDAAEAAAKPAAAAAARTARR